MQTAPDLVAEGHASDDVPLKATLGVIAETLLIPLAARVLAPRLNPDLAFRDPIAEALLKRLDADPQRFAGDRGSMRGTIIRARWFDKVVKRFIAEHPEALIVSMGSGLDARAQRVDYVPKGTGQWIDLDVPEVVSIREKLLPKASGVENLAVDLNDTAWIDQVPWSAGQPALFFAEGVMMYLQPANAHALVRAVGRRADELGAHLGLAFDCPSPWMVRNSRRHPSLRKTKASFHWSLRRPTDLMALDPRLLVAEQFDITAGSGHVAAFLGKLHRLLTGCEMYTCVHFDRTPNRLAEAN